MTRLSATFPPRPKHVRGRSREVATLALRLTSGHPTRLALIGPGGSGKSTLAAAVGHKVSRRFRGNIHWFRVGAWSRTTLLTMLALRFGTRRQRPAPALRRYFESHGDHLIVLDNLDDDRAPAELLRAFSNAPVSWLLTARRCLLAGVSIFPVTAPLITSARTPFPAVAPLTNLLRHNPLSLSIATALVEDGQVTVSGLRDYLIGRGVDKVTVIEDEDDLPEVRLLIAWTWPRLDARARRLLAVLVHAGGDNIDRESLLYLAGAGRRDTSLERLKRWNLVQEPLAERYALHAAVRRALRQRVTFDTGRLFEHYVGLLEAEPERLESEQTHLFSAMDYAQEQGDLDARVRMAELLRRLDF